MLLSCYGFLTFTASPSSSTWRSNSAMSTEAMGNGWTVWKKTSSSGSSIHVEEEEEDQLAMADRQVQVSLSSRFLLQRSSWPQYLKKSSVVKSLLLLCLSPFIGQQYLRHLLWTFPGESHNMLSIFLWFSFRIIPRRMSLLNRSLDTMASVLWCEPHISSSDFLWLWRYFLNSSKTWPSSNMGK